jgi:hypothetical protein
MLLIAAHITADHSLAKRLNNRPAGGTVKRDGKWRRLFELMRSYDWNKERVVLLVSDKSESEVRWMATIDGASYTRDMLGVNIRFSEVRRLAKPLPHDRITVWPHGTTLAQARGRDADYCTVDERDLGRRPSSSRVASTTVNANRNARLPKAPVEIVEEIDSDPKTKDIESTTRAALIYARIGQGRYRRQLLKIWEGRCAVTGCGATAVLFASHVKAWSDSSNEERLDAYNGLLLAPNLDRLFDKGLIGFSNTGRVVFSSKLPRREGASLGVNAATRLRFVLPRHLPYLEAHRRRHALD